MISNNKKLSTLPSIDLLLGLKEAAALSVLYSRPLVKSTCRSVLEETRVKILRGESGHIASRETLAGTILDRVKERLEKEFAPSLRPVINATGIILHTGLGRAPLSQAAQENILRVVQGYSSLEIDLETGKRGERTEHVAHLLCKLTGAEDALVVNNNAAAVFLALNTLAQGREAVISRGQLIEIGGSFRIPDVMEKSGVIMREIGTTNKTKRSDYEKAIGDKTGVIVVAHTSNYRILGFTAQVPLKEITGLATHHKIPVLHDLGGGVLVNLTHYGLPYEPLVQDSLAAGVDVVTFSGDKVLGGPQSGIIVGKKKWLRRIHANPIMRAVRCGKLTYAALEATLKLYFQKEDLRKNIKVLGYLAEPLEEVNKRAERLQQKIPSGQSQDFIISKEASSGQTGSGALPLESLSSVAIVLKSKSIGSEKLAAHFRQHQPPVIGYIKNDKLYFDMRTVSESELDEIAAAFAGLMQE